MENEILSQLEAAISQIKGLELVLPRPEENAVLLVFDNGYGEYLLKVEAV